jgi:hypothetical protein
VAAGAGEVAAAAAAFVGAEVGVVSKGVLYSSVFSVPLWLSFDNGYLHREHHRCIEKLKLA